jgi:hypothetical protein
VVGRSPHPVGARTAIDFVGGANDWMRDRKAAADDTYAFQPDRLESRKLFARALFRAFGSMPMKTRGCRSPISRRATPSTRTRT